jgi:hypothetical protein
MSKKFEVKVFMCTGLVALEDLLCAFVVFNGGFKIMHGNYGMKFNDIVWVDLRVCVCMIVMYVQDCIVIRFWEDFEFTKVDMVWFC